MKLEPEEPYQVNEYEEFSLTYTIVSEDSSPEPEPLPEIINVTITSPDGDFSSLVTNTINNNSFTISGMFADVFNREMHYIMPDKNHYVARRWQDIPQDFETVYKYVGAQQNSITLNVNVETTQGSLSTEIKVLNNHIISNQKLKDYIAMGVY